MWRPKHQCQLHAPAPPSALCLWAALAKHSGRVSNRRELLRACKRCGVLREPKHAGGKANCGAVAPLSNIREGLWHQQQEVPTTATRAGYAGFRRQGTRLCSCRTPHGYHTSGYTASRMCVKKDGGRLTGVSTVPRRSTTSAVRIALPPPD